MSTQYPQTLYQFHVPARLAAGATDPDAAFPHGGVDVGRVLGPIALRVVDTSVPFEFEGRGGAQMHVHVGRAYEVTAAIRNANTTALNTLGFSALSDTAVNGFVSRGMAPWQENGGSSTSTPFVGRLRTSTVLIVSPELPRLHKSLVCYAAVPTWDVAPIIWRRGEEMVLALRFLLEPDATNRIFDFGLLSEARL